MFNHSWDSGVITAWSELFLGYWQLQLVVFAQLLNYRLGNRFSCAHLIPHSHSNTIVTSVTLTTASDLKKSHRPTLGVFRYPVLFKASSSGFGYSNLVSLAVFLTLHPP